LRRSEEEEEEEGEGSPLPRRSSPSAPGKQAGAEEELLLLLLLLLLLRAMSRYRRLLCHLEGSGSHRTRSGRCGEDGRTRRKKERERGPQEVLPFFVSFATIHAFFEVQLSLFASLSETTRGADLSLSSSSSSSLSHASPPPPPSGSRILQSKGEGKTRTFNQF
jgi:hypothetical protein